MSAEPILILDKLSLYDSKRTFFNDISFALYQGESLAIMGPSGIGKSILSKAIAGFLPSTISLKGSIKLNGIEVSQRNLLQRDPAQRPSVIFQDALKALNPLASVEKQLALALTGNQTKLKHADKTQILSLLTQLGFTQPQSILALYPSQLSGGQRQRICIAMALLGNTNLIIADEPNSALDPITATDILGLLLAKEQKNISKILITHDIFSALACDKLLVIADESKIAFGNPKETLEQSQHPFCQQLTTLVASH